MIATEAPVHRPVLEIPRNPDFSVTALSPENDTHRLWAKTADLASLEAYNPFTGELDPELAHDAMTDRQLTRWMRGDMRHMARFLVVDPGRFDEFVDPEVFADALKANPALADMKKHGVVGFTYLYNDSHTDSDFRRRAGKFRAMEGKPANHSVWEMNFWFVPGTKDAPATGATGSALREFASHRGTETTTVMFADDGDMRESWSEKSGKPAETLLRWSQGRIETAITQFQDTRVLRGLGFASAGRMEYVVGEGNKPDFAFIARISQQSLH